MTYIQSLQWRPTESRGGAGERPQGEGSTPGWETQEKQPRWPMCHGHTLVLEGTTAWESRQSQRTSLKKGRIGDWTQNPKDGFEDRRVREIVSMFHHLFQGLCSSPLVCSLVASLLSFPPMSTRNSFIDISGSTCHRPGLLCATGGGTMEDKDG